MAQNLKGEPCTVQPAVAPKPAPTATPDNYQQAFDTAVQNAQKLSNFAQSGGNVCMTHAWLLLADYSAKAVLEEL